MAFGSEIVEKALDAVRTIPNVDEFGMVHFGPLDRYMAYLGVNEDDADELIDVATERLVGDGEWTDVSGSLYVTDVLEENEREEELLAEEQRWYQMAVDAAWSARF